MRVSRGDKPQVTLYEDDGSVLVGSPGSINLSFDSADTLREWLHYAGVALTEAQQDAEHDERGCCRSTPEPS